MAIDALSAIEDLDDGHKWFKLVFDIVDSRRATIGNSSLRAIVFRALGGTPAGDIGFEACVPLMGWNNQNVEEDFSVDWGRILLRSIGAPTDRLLRLLEESFELPVSGNTAAQEISCLAVLLGDDPADIEHEEIHSKLFFDGSKEQTLDSYAELFFNFDLAARRVWLMEKDTEYRTPLVAWFGGRYRQANKQLH